MDVKNTKKLIHKCMEHNLTPFLWGKAGIGKSQIIKQIADELKVKCVDLRLGQMEVGDLTGIPDRDGNTTVWLRPTWFPTDDSRGILFLDEINRARLDVLQAVFQLVLDRRLNTHVLPEGWKIVCAGNPAGGDYFVSDLDPALLNRFVHIKLTPLHTEFIEHAKGAAFHKSVIGFIHEYPDMLGNEMVDIPLEIVPTPRGWEMYGKIISGLDINNDADQKLMFEAGVGIVGSTATISFMESFKQTKKYIRGEEVLKNFAKVKPELKEMLDTTDGKEIRIDLINMSLEEVLDITVNHEFKFTEKTEKNFVDFLVLLPVDLRLAAIRRMTKDMECPASKVIIKQQYTDCLYSDTKKKLNLK